MDQRESKFLLTNALKNTRNVILNTTSENPSTNTHPARDHETSQRRYQYKRTGEALTDTTGGSSKTDVRWQETAAKLVNSSGFLLPLNKSEELLSEASRLEFTSSTKDLLREKKLAELRQINQSKDLRKGSPYFFTLRVSPFNKAPRDHESGEYHGYTRMRGSVDQTWTTREDHRRSNSWDDIRTIEEMDDLSGEFTIVRDNDGDTNALAAREAREETTESFRSWITRLLQGARDRGAVAAGDSDSDNDSDCQRRSLHVSCSNMKLATMSDDDSVNMRGTTIDTQDEVFRQEMLIKSWPWPSLTITSEADLRRFVSRADWKCPLLIKDDEEDLEISFFKFPYAFPFY